MFLPELWWHPYQDGRVGRMSGKRARFRRRGRRKRAVEAERAAFVKWEMGNRLLMRCRGQRRISVREWMAKAWEIRRREIAGRGRKMFMSNVTYTKQFLIQSSIDTELPGRVETVPEWIMRRLDENNDRHVLEGDGAAYRQPRFPGDW